MSVTTTEHAREDRAELLKERIYITFTALAVVLALRAHPEDSSPERAALTLLIAVAGTLLAVFVADVVSHITVHEQVPDARELRHMVRVSFGAAGVVVLPLAFLALAAFEVWVFEGALRASMIALVASLVVVGYLAVRRVKLPFWQRLLVLFAEFALGLAVIGLEVLAH